MAKTNMSSEDIQRVVKDLKTETLQSNTLIKVPIHMTPRPIDPPKNEEDAKREARELARQQDTLLQHIQRSPFHLDTYRVLNEEMASEIFALKYAREEGEAQGKDTTEISKQRMRALKSLADNYFKAYELASRKHIDFESAEMRLIISLLIAKFRESMRKAGVVEATERAVYQFLQECLNTFAEEAQQEIERSRH